MDTLFKIGELAKRSGMTVEALRFYETKGILESQKRSEGGYRLYNETALQQMQFIKHTKELGFSLTEIREFLDLKNAGGEDCHEIRNQVLAKIAEVDQKIYDLQRVRDSLHKLTITCNGEDSVADCPILHHFGSSEVPHDCC